MKQVVLSEEEAKQIGDALWDARSDIWQHIRVAEFNLTGKDLSFPNDAPCQPGIPKLIHRAGIEESQGRITMLEQAAKLLQSRAESSKPLTSTPMNQSPSDAVQQPSRMSLEDTFALIKPPGSQQLCSFHGPFSILVEKHEEGCACSYCKGFASKGRAGIELPESKAPSSWRILWWRWKGDLRLVRWTLPRRGLNNDPLLRAQKSLGASISAMTQGKLQLVRILKSNNRITLELQQKDGSVTNVTAAVDRILSSGEGVRCYLLRCVREQVIDNRQ